MTTGTRLQQQGDGLQVLCHRLAFVNAFRQVGDDGDLHHGISHPHKARRQHAGGGFFGYKGHTELSVRLQQIIRGFPAFFGAPARDCDDAPGQHRFRGGIADVAYLLIRPYRHRKADGGTDMPEYAPENAAGEQRDHRCHDQPHPGGGDAQIVVERFRRFHGLQAFFTEQFGFRFLGHGVLLSCPDRGDAIHIQHIIA